MSLEITALYAGLNGLILLVLAYGVVGHRRTKKLGLANFTDEDAIRAIRAHGNAAEYIPICLILLGISELSNSLPNIGLHIAGATLLVGRILHATGLVKNSGKSFGRFYGTLLTWLALLGLSGINVYAGLVGVFSN